MRKAKEKKSEAIKLLEKLSGGPLTLGRAFDECVSTFSRGDRPRRLHPPSSASSAFASIRLRVSRPSVNQA